MTYNDIQNAIISGKYKVKIKKTNLKRLPEDTIIDPTKSKIWNQDQVQQHNDELDILLNLREVDIEEKIQSFRNDVISYLVSELSDSYSLVDFCPYPPKINEVANFLFDKGYQNYQLCGKYVYMELNGVLDSINNLLSVITKTNIMIAHE